MDNRVLLNDQLDRLDQAAEKIENSDFSQYIPVVKTRRSELVRDMYADLFIQKRYQKAVSFLANDLLGDSNLLQRGLDLKKAKTAMTRMMPDPLLGTVARSVEFTAVTLEIELALAAQLHETVNSTEAISHECFISAINVSVNRNSLLEQSRLVIVIGNEIESVVHKPFISTALKMCRRPARLMGLGDLQDFLERGFDAFRVMKGSQYFLNLFEEREAKFIDSIYSQDR